MGTETIYAYWDSQQIQAILNGVAMITSGGDYHGLLKVFAIVGLFVAVGVGFAKAQGQEAGVYFIMLGIWYFTLLVPTVSVDIQDTMSGGNYTVANVPLGLGVFAAEESHIGYWLTNEFETVFSIPSAVGFQQAGFQFPSLAVTERMNSTFSDPNLNQSMSNFVINCVEPEFAGNPNFMESELNSDAIWPGLNGQMNPGRLVSVYNGTQFATMGCDTAYSTLDPQLTNYTNNTLIPKFVQLIYPQNNNLAAATSLIESQTPVSDSLMLGSSQTTADAIEQAAMINALKQATYDGPASVGDTATTQVALATAMAESSANVAYLTTANMAKQAMPIVRSAIHMLLLALFPFVMLLIIMAGAQGGKVFKSYALALLWINLWAPIYAIVNFITISYAAYSVMPQGVSGLTFDDHVSIVHTLLTQQAVAGMLTVSVPAIAWALIQGIQSAGSLASNMMAPATSAGQSAGGQVGTGNANVGNTSWGNVQMRNNSTDQWNTAPTNRHGAAISQGVGQDGSVISSFGNGGSTIATPQNSTPFSGSVGSQQSAQLSQQAEKSWTASRADTVAANQASSAVLGQVLAHNREGRHSVESGHGGGHQVGGGYGGGVTLSDGTKVSYAELADYKRKIDAGETAQAAAQAEWGDGGGSANNDAVGNQGAGSKAKANVLAQANQKYDAGVGRDEHAKKDASSGSTVDKGQKFLDQLTSDKSFRDSVMGSEGNSQSVKSELQNRTEHSQKAQAEMKTANALKEAAQQSSTTSSGSSVDPFKTASVADIQALNRAVTANPGQAHQIMSDWMNKHGFSQGSTMPTTNVDGSPVVSTPDDVQAAYNADAAQIPDNVAAAHADNDAQVPQNVAMGPNSKAANTNRGMEQQAKDYAASGQAKVDQGLAQSSVVMSNNDAKFRGDSGFDHTFDQGHGQDMTTYNKLANTADDMAWNDIKTSGQQAMPGWTGLHAPTLNEYQQQVNGENKPTSLGEAKNPQPGNNSLGWDSFVVKKGNGD
jgi:hypothetical protein